MIPSPGRRWATAISSARATSGASATAPIATHDPAGEAVQHAGEVRRALAGRDLLHVRAPQLVRAVGLEVALDQIRPDLHPSTPSAQSALRRRLGGTYAPWMPCMRISRSIRLWLTSWPARRSSACTRRDP